MRSTSYRGSGHGSTQRIAPHRACSIEPVYKELLSGNDELADWARENKEFFRPIDQDATLIFPALSMWAQSRNFTPAALAQFTGTNADYLLVAYSCAHHHIVVTHERSRPNAHARVLIPDACTAMGVTTADTFEMLRKTGARLELGDPRNLQED